MARRVGVPGYRYEHVEGWGEFPRGGVVSDVATDSEDRVYACVRLRQGPDGNEGEMWVFDRDGKLLDRWGRDIFTVPHGLVHPRRRFCTTQTPETIRVRSFTPDGKTLMVLGTEGEQGPEGEPFRSPTNATIAVSGDLYVSDGYEQNRCHRFSPAGELKHSWGRGDAVYYQMEAHGEVTGVVGDGPGEFNLPHGIVTDSSGQVYVMDRENGRVQVFTAEGEYMTEWNDVPGGNDAVIDGEGMIARRRRTGRDFCKDAGWRDGGVVGRARRGGGPVLGISARDMDRHAGRHVRGASWGAAGVGQVRARVGFTAESAEGFKITQVLTTERQGIGWKDKRRTT